MNGIEILVDTNILINLSEGKENVDRYLDNAHIFVSVITEIELLGWHKITESQNRFFRTLLNDCQVIELLPEVKRTAIEIRRTNKIKIPDAIIAATSLYLDIPLLTHDSGFSKIKNLNLLLIS
jgi:predicted nucleic acid-binding protein